MFTVEEAAGHLKIHPRTVIKLITRGELPARKVGRQWRIPEDAIWKMTAGRVREDGGPLSNPVPPERTCASAVLDIPVGSSRAAESLINSVNGALNSRDPGLGPVQCHSLYDGSRGIVRISIWAGISFLRYFFALMERTEEDKDGFGI